MKGYIMTKVSKAADLFTSGVTMTEGELATRLNTTRVGARGVVRTLRSKGYAIFLNAGTMDERGRQRQSRYRLGTATRAMTAAAYEAMGAR